MDCKKLKLNNYTNFLEDILDCIHTSQYQAFLAVTLQIIDLYWNIGKKITDIQKKENWGSHVVKQLSKDLQEALPQVKGFSSQNLWRMQKFYNFYINKPKLQKLAKSIGWSHNLEIITKCKDNLECEFYIRMTNKYGWSKNILLQQIENKAYEKTFSSQTNFDLKLPPEIRNQAKLAVKDEYIFDFLELGEKYHERTLEKALILNIESFLQEIGQMYTFAGSQYRLEIDDKEYFIDILLYHRKLRSLIAIELKIGEFIPEYVGKMQFYLALLDDTVKLKEEKPSIGIILCKSKNKTVVEYALRESKKPIGIATYSITATLPKELERKLPKPEQIAKLLEGIEKKSLTPTSITSKYTNNIVKKIKKKIISYIKKHGAITNQEYQEIANVKKRQATKELKILVEKNLLEKIGNRGRGTYYILEKK